MVPATLQICPSVQLSQYCCHPRVAGKTDNLGCAHMVTLGIVQAVGCGQDDGMRDARRVYKGQSSPKRLLVNITV